MTLPNEITVKVLKHDGAEYRRWRGRLTRREDSLIVLDGEFDVDVTHEVLGAIKAHTRTVEYYWFDRWYNVFRFLDDDGNTRIWYCNINTPPIFDGAVLTYVDLDIDIVVCPDFSYQVLDMKEFEANAESYGYSPEERARAHAAVDELLAVIAGRQFPFAIQPASMVNV